jgi:hypothetical protein
LVGELILLPLVTLLVLLATASENNREHAVVHRLVNRLLMAVAMNGPSSRRRGPQ